jgi:hypothetical protein
VLRFVLQRADDLAKAEAVLGADQDDDIYTQIEKERAELKKTGILTPVTFDSFVAWKVRVRVCVCARALAMSFCSRCYHYAFVVVC